MEDFPDPATKWELQDTGRDTEGKNKLNDKYFLLVISKNIWEDNIYFLHVLKQSI